MSSVIGLISAIALAASPVQDRGLEPINPKNSDVIPIAFSSFPPTVPTDTDSIRVRSTLRNANRYALTTWYDSVKNFDAQTGLYLNLGGWAEQQLRPPASQAFSLAISLKLGAYRGWCHWDQHYGCRSHYGQAHPLYRSGAPRQHSRRLERPRQGQHRSQLADRPVGLQHRDGRMVDVG